MSKELKIEAAKSALDFVKNGMRLGIGTGSTAEEFIRLLAVRVDGGLDVIGVPTSERSRIMCDELGIKLATLEEQPELDLTIDGADEVDGELNLIKGGGGALLREKIVAAASAKMVVIADKSKMVETLGAFDLPIEVNAFGLASTMRAINKVTRGIGVDCPLSIRGGESEPFYTDGGHLIVDAKFGRIVDARTLSRMLLEIPGVVQHGLFLDMASAVIIASDSGIEVLTK